MKLKTYQACSMADALAAVKRDLGRDAVILHTRSFRKGGLLGFGGRQMWEITASQNVNVPARPVRPAGRATAPAARRPAGPVAVIDGPTIMPQAEPAEADAPAAPVATAALAQQVGRLTGMVERLLRRQEEGQPNPDSPPVPEELFEVYLNLIQQEVAEDIARDLIARVRAELTGDQLGDRALIMAKLQSFIASMIPTSLTAAGAPAAGWTSPGAARSAESSAPAGGRPRVIALIGPTGVGKTTTIAKLAANLKLRQHRRVGLITIDTYRIAAVEQLRTYAQIIHVPLRVVMTPEELTAAIAEMADRDVVLIDTAGRSPGNAERLDELKAFLAAAAADEVHLVLATTAHQKNLQSAMERFGALGVDRLILTKLDEAVSFGMILNIVRHMDAALSFVTTGQDVPDDIEVGEGRRLAELIVGGSC